MKTFRKRSREEWQQVVKAWRESGLGVTEFCSQQGLETGSFYAWRKRFGFGTKAKGAATAIRGQSKKPQIKFLPVQVRESSAGEPVMKSPQTSQRVEIFLGNGAVIRFNGELSGDNLSRIMNLVAGATC